MSLKIEIDSWDYTQAIEAVQKLLDNIEHEQEHESSPVKIIGIPTATEIVDLVWDKIR